MCTGMTTGQTFHVTPHFFAATIPNLSDRKFLLLMLTRKPQVSSPYPSYQKFCATTPFYPGRFIFENILENINVNIIDISKFAPTSSEQINEELIYSKKETKLDLIESGDNFLLYNIRQKLTNLTNNHRKFVNL